MSQHLTQEEESRIERSTTKQGSTSDHNHLEQVLHSWQCGNSYRYNIPKPDGDPWEVLMNYFVEVDRKRCESLSSTIQSTLLVAGLFSAVVVGLYVYQLPKIEADPQDELIRLLTLMVNMTANSANRALVSNPLDSWNQTKNNFDSEQADGDFLIYVISVWICMATVMLGVSALQWINEFQEYPKSTPKQHFAIMSMRKDSFHKWHVPMLVKLLPVLLVASVYTFTVSLSLLRNVAADVEVLQLLMGIVLTFIIFLLTVLPALEEYMLQFPSINPFIRGRIQATPCPYRSIQGNMWRLIVISNKITLYLFIGWAYFFLVPLYILVTTFKKTWISHVHPTFTVSSLQSPYRHGTWGDLDWEWLMIRWSHFTELYDAYLQVHVKPRDVSGRHFDDRLLYDAIEGLIAVAEGYVTQPNILYAAYHCFVDLSLDTLGLLSDDQPDTVAPPDVLRSNRYIQALLANPTNRLPFRFSSLSSAVPQPTLLVLHVENLMLFLQAVFARGAARMTPKESLDPVWPPAFSTVHLPLVSKHLAELQTRVRGHFYGDRVLNTSEQLVAENHNLLPRTDDWSVVFFYQYVKNSDMKIEFSRRHLALFTGFLEECGRDWALEFRLGALLTHNNLHHFILDGARAALHIASTGNAEQLADIHGALFAPLRSTLNMHLSHPLGALTTPDNTGTTDVPPIDCSPQRNQFRGRQAAPDLLFYCSCLYVRHLVERGGTSAPVMESLNDVLPLLRRYRARCAPNNIIERSLGASAFAAPGWWAFLADPSIMTEEEAASSARKASGKLLKGRRWPQVSARTGMKSTLSIQGRFSWLTTSGRSKYAPAGTVGTGGNEASTAALIPADEVMLQPIDIDILNHSEYRTHGGDDEEQGHVYPSGKNDD